MRISDWSSDVCSSDLAPAARMRCAQSSSAALGIRVSCTTATWLGWMHSRPPKPMSRASAAARARPSRFLMSGKTLRSEERRVGKECGSTCRYRGEQDHEKKKESIKAKHRVQIK